MLTGFLPSAMFLKERLTIVEGRELRNITFI
jgi:hypothetical protein